MRGSIHQGDPDALITKERNSRGTQSTRLAIRSVLDLTGPPQLPDEMQSAATQR